MSELAKGNITTKNITYVAIFVSLISVCSFISIPFQVPITMQSFAVMMCGAILGRKRGVTAVLIYILLGIVGVPVFAGFSSGFSVILGPSGGFIIGFIFMAFIIGLFSDKFSNNYILLVISMFVGLLICYSFGCFWFLFIYSKGSSNLLTCLTLCVVPFIIPDLIKILLACYITKKLSSLSL